MALSSLSFHSFWNPTATPYSCNTALVRLTLLLKIPKDSVKPSWPDVWYSEPSRMSSPLLPLTLQTHPLRLARVLLPTYGTHSYFSAHISLSSQTACLPLSLHVEHLCLCGTENNWFFYVSICKPDYECPRADSAPTNEHTYFSTHDYHQVFTISCKLTI